MDASWGFDNEPCYGGEVNDAVCYLQDGGSWQLAQSLDIGTSQTDDLLEALNLWVDFHGTGFLRWDDDVLATQHGLPVLCGTETLSVGNDAEMTSCIYPNPASDTVFVNIGGARGVYSLFDSMGQEVAGGVAHGVGQIHVGDLPAGVYYLVLSLPSKTETHKILID